MRDLEKERLLSDDYVAVNVNGEHYRYAMHSLGQ